MGKIRLLSWLNFPFQIDRFLPVVHNFNADVSDQFNRAFSRLDCLIIARSWYACAYGYAEHRSPFISALLPGAPDSVIADCDRAALVIAERDQSVTFKHCEVHFTIAGEWSDRDHKTTSGTPSQNRSCTI
jgi:hypothetical protein